MESSVDAYINAQPEQALPYDEWFHEKGYDKHGIGSAYNPLRRFTNWVSGEGARLNSEYKAYLDNINIRNEHLASQSAKAWDKMMDDTKYQRMFKDFEAAGLNPYLLVNSGSFSASAPTSAKASYKQDFYDKDKKIKESGRNIALILLALARVAAAAL